MSMAVGAGTIGVVSEVELAADTCPSAEFLTVLLAERVELLFTDVVFSGSSAVLVLAVDFVF